MFQILIYRLVSFVWMTLNTETPKTHDVRFGEPLAAGLPLLKKWVKTIDWDCGSGA